MQAGPLYRPVMVPCGSILAPTRIGGRQDYFRPARHAFFLLFVPVIPHVSVWSASDEGSRYRRASSEVQVRKGLTSVCIRHLMSLPAASGGYGWAGVAGAGAGRACR